MRQGVFHTVYIWVFLVTLPGCSSVKFKPNIEVLEGAYLITAENGNKLLVTPYGDNMVRLQSTRENESFYDNDHYEMVEHHNWSRGFQLENRPLHYVIKNHKLSLVIEKQSLKTAFYLGSRESPVLSEKRPVSWSDNNIKVEFNTDDTEHFTGLGHGYYAKSKSLDLKGQKIERNYGTKPIEQAPLIVPFYMSDKGYGVFLNSTFSNQFSFGADNQYSFSINDHGFSGRMDYFFIAGPELKQVLVNYTSLTGKPRLPQKAIFGLQLSDKGHDHNSATPSDMKWWKSKIQQHRAHGFPLDHVVNDNRWRAGGGKRCESRIEWDDERYPDPTAYQEWLEDNGLVLTLDFNRCIAQYSEGWQSSFNLPETGDIEFPDSAPDLTNTAFREWFWRVFKEQALKAEKAFPGDALWIDEFDEQGHAPKEMILANGLSSGEMRNYWFFLISKALVEEGWDVSGIKKRPFVWVRGMTAGAQRYATLWSGDIYPNYQDMESQIRGMQLAGISGFPYWGHDAGGFFDWKNNTGPDETMYQRWAMAYGSFAPIWKPHGMGQSRWPLDRNSASQITALKFSHLRYRLMPYLYSAAKIASETGIPIARPMLLEHQNEPMAWQFDLQYMWGESFLVAPLTKDHGARKVWLPKGIWYDFQIYEKRTGGEIIEVTPDADELPLFVKAGAIIPERPFAVSTAFIDKTQLKLSVFTGADGQYTLAEDDDVTEAYRLRGESQSTIFEYWDKPKTFVINPPFGTYRNAPEFRDIKVVFLGLEKQTSVIVNGKEKSADYSNNVLTVDLGRIAAKDKVVIEL